VQVYIVRRFNLNGQSDRSSRKCARGATGVPARQVR
jgi:hypothetical protein